MKITSMTFRSLEGIVAENIAPRSHPPWWLRSRYGASERTYGAMYCPLCLSEDKVPYFRLSWRLGFNTCCERHQVLYRDSCEHCASPPWPAGCSGQYRLSPSFFCFSKCWCCGQLLTSQLAQASETTGAISRWIEAPSVTIGADEVPPLEAFAALRAICQLFIRTRTRRLLLSTGRWPDLEKLEGLISGYAVEHLNVLARNSLTSAALDLLRDWPTNFVKYAKESGVSRAHFCGVAGLQPEWMNAVVDAQLSKQNRSVTAEEIQAAIKAIRAETGTVTKAAVHRRLNWFGDLEL